MAIAGFPMPSDSTGLDIPSNSMGLEQNINNDALGPTVCNKTSEKKSIPVKKRQKTTKKRRNLSPEERQRRSDAMKAILARKAERKAQSIV
jgi:hypothetical protein